MIRLETPVEIVDKDLWNRCEQGVGSLLKRKDIGFFDLPQRDEVWQSSQQRADDLKSEFSEMGVLGIGGSTMGTRSFLQALAHQTSEHSVHVFDNVDPLYFFARLEKIKDWSKMHWVVISKSGTTVETLNMANHVFQKLTEKQVKDPYRCFTVISEDKDSILANWARENNIALLPVPVDVGGRYSVLTPVGLLPLAFAGLDVDEIRRGAQWALQQSKMITTLAAQSMESFRREEWIFLAWAYCDGLIDFGGWLQQLWSESLGKRVDLQKAEAPRVSTPFFCRGSTDQHSVLQQVMEGARDKFICLIRVKQSEEAGPQLNTSQFPGQESLVNRGMGDLLAAEAEATAEALREVGISTMILHVDKLDAQTMGALTMLWELVVGSLGEVLGINAFNQPGVELGKRLAREKLEKSN